MRGALGRGAAAGAVAGAAAVAAMEVASVLSGLRTLPDLFQQPILAAVPGPVFGILIDTLQHWGKVIEEAGLLILMILVLAGLGALTGLVSERLRWPPAGLGAGLLAWLAVMLAIEPAAGLGLGGLDQGIAAPAVWALVFLVYGLVWRALWTSPARRQEPADAGRRRFLGGLGAGIALGSAGLIGALRAPAWARALLAPSEAAVAGDAARAAPPGWPLPETTPPADFYQVSKNFEDPVVPATGWSLSVTGLVGRPLALSYPELRSLPARTEVVTLECISNEVGGSLMSTASFTGVQLADLVGMAGPQSGAGALAFRSRDGYTESLPLSLVTARPDILVAYDLGGRPLAPEHGFPARVVVPGRYGMKSPKWLDEIRLVARPEGGYWEAQGWAPDTPVRTTARFDQPSDGAVVGRGPVTLAGVAFAGTRGVGAVEWSADGGRSWRPAALRPPPSPLTWVLWKATWVPGQEGAYRLLVRARDGGGKPQAARPAGSFPGGATGYHAISVDVGR